MRWEWLLSEGGVTKSSGDAMNIKTDTSNPPDDIGDVNIAAVVCISDTPCPGVGSLDQGAIPVREAQISIREVPDAPSGIGGGDIKGATQLPNSTFCSATAQANPEYIQNPEVAPVPNETAWLCVVDNISLKGNDELLIYSDAATVDASGPTSYGGTVPVRLWVEEDISLGGNSDIRHVQDSLGSPVDVVAFAGTPANYSNLHIYGNNDGASQTWELRGTAAGLAAFFYAPSASCEMGGGGGAANNILGQIWCNSFDINGSVNVTVPPSDGGGAGGGGGATSFPPSIFDFVARSTWGTRLFGQN